MKSNKIFALLLAVLLTSGCGGGGGSSPPPNNSGSTGGTNTSGGTSSTGGATNILTISVNDPSTPNKPTVSVTVCTPGTSNCQAVDNILLDTGSYGLRIFKQAFQSNSLPQSSIASGSLAECVAFLDGSGVWGPVKTADVVLGGETAPKVPIQIIDAAFFANAIPLACKSPNVAQLAQDPASAGFNGILGVGLFVQDCGQGCAFGVNNRVYFACNGAQCSGTTVPNASQVQNPVALLPQDNNGIIVQLPSVSAGGAPSVTGQLILGIGTRPNNTPSGVTSFPASSGGEFTTIFNGATLIHSFIDSGSNGLFFNAPASILPICSPPNQDWFCPQDARSLSATMVGATGSPSSPVSFLVANAASIFGKGVSAELGGPIPAGSGFDWGMPFFYGRQVLVGIDGKSSTLGSGPYWAY